MSEWSELVAEWGAHVLSHSDLSSWVAALQNKLIDELGDQTPRQLINHDEATQSLREAIVQLLLPHAMTFITSPAFSSWCQSYPINTVNHGNEQ